MPNMAHCRLVDALQESQALYMRSSGGISVFQVCCICSKCWELWQVICHSKDSEGEERRWESPIGQSEKSGGMGRKLYEIGGVRVYDEKFEFIMAYSVLIYIELSEWSG